MGTKKISIIFIFLIGTFQIKCFPQIKKVYFLTPFTEDGLRLLFNKNSPYHALKTLCKKNGFSLIAPSSSDIDLSDASCILMMDDQFEKFNLHNYDKERLILLLTEPPCVIPHIYSEIFFNKFQIILTWKTDLVDGKKILFLPYPGGGRTYTSTPVSFNNKKLLTIVCGNKKSSHPDELYSKRLNIINYFEKMNNKDFDFYGTGWGSEYKNYRGIIHKGDSSYKDKVKIIKKYKFYLCYENMTNINGYITEKIFDCFEAGCVPIYLGASDINLFIPEGCYIDQRKFESFEEVYKYTQKITEKEYMRYLENIKKFLSSDAALIYSNDFFAQSVMKTLQELAC